MRMRSNVGASLLAIGPDQTTHLFQMPTKSPPKGGLLVSTALSEQLQLRCFFFQRLLLRGLLVPTTAERLVQIDRAEQLRRTVGDQYLLGTEQLTLGVEEGQVAVDANAITTLGQTVVVLVGGDEITLGLQL